MAIEHRRVIGEHLPLRDVMERLFEGSFVSPQSVVGQGTFPPVDLFMTDDDVIVKLAAPGARQDDFSISVSGDTVTVMGEVKLEPHAEKGHAYIQEIWQGKFQRSFRLPIQVDAEKAEASFEHGILTLHLPKAESTKLRKIPIGKQPAVSGQKEQALEGHVQKERVSAKTS
jgi:HSP20 family protein